jgi:RNA polymerase sigma factor (sigma-70 family)
MSNDSLLYKVYLASRKSLWRAVSRIVPPHEIEDIVQETYVRICQIDHKENISSPKSFMFTVARNLALDYQKQANVKQVDHVEDIELLDQLLSDNCRDEVYDQALSASEFAVFCEAVRLLPVQCRKVFVLKKVYGYSQREIAGKLRISESTVEKHIATGMKSCTLFMRKATEGEKGQGNPNAHRPKRGGSHE